MHEYHKRHYDYMCLTERDLVEKIFKKNEKKELTAYLLWAIGFPLGLHRIYTGNYGTALIIAIVSVFTLGLGAIVGLLDGLQIKRLVFNKNDEIISQIAKEFR